MTERHGQFFAGQFRAMRNRAFAEWTQADNPGIPGIAVRLDGAGLPDTLTADPVVSEQNEYDAALFIGLFGEGNFRYLRRLAWNQRRHGHLRHADQK